MVITDSSLWLLFSPKLKKVNARVPLPLTRRSQLRGLGVSMAGLERVNEILPEVTEGIEDLKAVTRLDLSSNGLVVKNADSMRWLLLDAFCVPQKIFFFKYPCAENVGQNVGLANFGRFWTKVNHDYWLRHFSSEASIPELGVSPRNSTYAPSFTPSYVLACSNSLYKVLTCVPKKLRLADVGVQVPSSDQCFVLLPDFHSESSGMARVCHLLLPCLD